MITHHEAIAVENGIIFILRDDEESIWRSMAIPNDLGKVKLCDMADWLNKVEMRKLCNSIKEESKEKAEIISRLSLDDMLKYGKEMLKEEFGGCQNG